MKQNVSPFIQNSMLINKPAQKEIVRRAVQAGEIIGDDPKENVHPLGPIYLSDGTIKDVWLRHGTDAIVIDPVGHIVLIVRKHPPGAGKWATPGGFIDPVCGTSGVVSVENAAEAALRELWEETSFDRSLLRGIEPIPVGGRNYARPYDIREAWKALKGTPIEKGDLFIASTRGYLFNIPTSLDECDLKAKDDAKDVTVKRVNDLRPEDIGVPDHYNMIRRAAQLARNAPQNSGRLETPGPA